MPDIDKEISAIKEKLGAKLSIVAHHYQADGIVRHADVIGDSLELSRKVAALESEFIVFCGVSFMAESAALLARDGQKVFLPAPEANCVMAQMTPGPLLDKVLGALNQRFKVLPLAYVNTSVATKAVVGSHGGAVCTSANAPGMLKWALDRSERVLFLPDKNLGRNTAKLLGLGPEFQHVIDVRKDGANTGSTPDTARLLLWPGCCAIHAQFTPAHIAGLRREHPGIKIAVHPECAPEIVEASDAAGSTSSLIRFAAEAPDGSTIAIGTEINLVRRLMQLHRGRIRIIPLHTVACSDMGKTTPEVLLSCLKGLTGDGPAMTPTRVDPAMAPPARLALTRMLEACK